MTWFVLGVVLLVFYRHARTSFVEAVGLGLLVGGGIYNFLEMAVFGSVLGYFSFFNLFRFNLADVTIVVGVGILVGRILFQETSSQKAPGQEPSSQEPSG